MTEKQVLQQVEVNYAAMDKVAAKMTMNLPPGQTAILQKELERLWQAQQYWANQYKAITGQTLILMAPLRLTDSRAEEASALEQQRKQSEARKKVQDAIFVVEREFTAISHKLQDQYDISVQWQNALFSHWTRMGAGLSAKHPLIIKKQVNDKVTPLLREAKSLLAEGKLQQAMQKTTAAAGWVKWGYESLNWWMDQLESGAKRAEAGIKVSAALAAIVVAAPLELGIIATAGVATVGEGAQQGTLLAAKGIEGKEQISPQDIKNAVLETVVAGGTAGVGKWAGKLVAKALGSRVAAEILKRAPSQAVIDFVEARIENYIAANSQAILKKLLALDKDPDMNWWYMIITPAINPIAMELAKEPDLYKR